MYEPQISQCKCHTNINCINAIEKWFEKLIKINLGLFTFQSITQIKSLKISLE